MLGGNGVVPIPVQRGRPWQHALPEGSVITVLLMFAALLVIGYVWLVAYFFLTDVSRYERASQH